MLINEHIADALRHLDVRFQSLVVSLEKEKNGDCAEIETSWGLI